MNKVKMFFKKLKRHLYYCIPYKGEIAYEAQFGPLVVMWYHKKKRKKGLGGLVKLGKLYIFWQRYWRW